MTRPACLIHAAYGDPNPAGLPISVGVPFLSGALREPEGLIATAPDGERRPASGRVLARWEDGSIRWLLVSFGARQAGAHELTWGGTSTAAEASGPVVKLDQRGDTYTLTTDRLRLVLATGGPGPIAHLACDGHVYLDDPSALRLCVDDASSLHEPARTIRVVEHTPRRARIRVEGAHHRAQGSRHLSYRLDIEVWAGWPSVRLDYQFLNLEPGADSRRVGRIALETRWKLGPRTQRHFLQSNYGLFYVSRHVFNPAPVSIRADLSRGDAHVEDPAMLLDDVDYPFYLHAPLVGTPGWLGVGGDAHSVYAQMHEMLLTRPNRLASAGEGIDAEPWPASAGQLDLPQGRSKRQTVLFSFFRREEQTPQKATQKLSNAPHQAPTGVAAALLAPIHEGRACVEPAWFAHCRVYEQDRALPFGRHVRVESNLASFMRVDFPYTKFDVGDTASGYAISYSAIDGGLVPPLPGAPEVPRLWPKASPTQTYLDLHEPVWINNEYDDIHALANELMRTGRLDLLPMLRLAARHNIEVDFLHYSDHRWLHRATPAHSARHTTSGAYPSHFWTQGLLEYYCLTGDDDALEVAEALGDKTIENFAEPSLREVLWGFNREVGWTVLAMAHLYDLTRDKRFKPLLDEIVNYLVGFDREGFRGAVNLSSGNDRMSLNRQIVANFFGYQSMVDGIDHYAAITGRPEVEAWLKKFCYDLADASLQAAREGSLPDTRFGLLYSVGYERTGDERFLRQIEMLLEQLYWNNQGFRPTGEMHHLGVSYRGITRMFGHAHRHGMLEAYEFPSVRKLRDAGGEPSQPRT